MALKASKEWTNAGQNFFKVSLKGSAHVYKLYTEVSFKACLFYSANKARLFSYERRSTKKTGYDDADDATKKRHNDKWRH